jgi:hypothetical protein
MIRVARKYKEKGFKCHGSISTGNVTGEDIRNKNKK